MSNTKFTVANVTEIQIKLNGNLVHNYPVKIRNEMPIVPYRMWHENTNRWYNPNSGTQSTLYEFMTNSMLFSHKFTAEESQNGWLSVELTLSEGYSSQMNMIIWTVNKTQLSIDRFKHIEKIIL